MKSRKSTKSKAAAILAASILVAMTIAGCDNPQRNAAEPEWKEEVLSAIEKSAKSEHDLFKLVMKYEEEWREWIRLFGQRIQDMLEENRSIPPSETEVKYSHSEAQLSAAARAFLMAYPHSKHYARVENLFREMLKFTAAYDAEEIEQIVREIRREQRER